LAPRCNEKNRRFNLVANNEFHPAALGQLGKEISGGSNLKRLVFIEQAKMRHGETKKLSAKAKAKPTQAATATAVPSPLSDANSVTTNSIPAADVPPTPSGDAPPAAIQTPFQGAPAAVLQDVPAAVGGNQKESLLPTTLTCIKNLRSDKDECKQEDVQKHSSLFPLLVRC
jgi:hypothetical protein